MRQVLAFALLFASCGSPKVKEILVREEAPKKVRLGETAHFVLDTEASSKLIYSGIMDLSVVSETVDNLGIEGVAKVDTIVGPKTFNVASEVETSILSARFISELRTSKTYQARNAHIEYVSLTPEGCDKIRVSEIRNYPDLTLDPTLCLSSATIPSVEITVRDKGLTISATFRADG